MKLNRHRLSPRRVAIGLAAGMLASMPANGQSTRPAILGAVGSLDRPVDAPGGEVNLRRTVTVEVVALTKNAVVNISAKKLVSRRVNPMGFDPFWQLDLGQMGQTVRVPADSLGSGFLVQRDGYVVTNNHVVDRARQISVELADGRKLPADLISADPDADLAILRIHDKSPFPTITLGDSSDLMIGEPVIAVGNPLGFSHSVSTGIVSALHRDIDPRPDGQPTTNAPIPHGEAAALHDLIQTDAAINPGNSGGPLLNAYGQVIGINTAIRGDAQNIGFAIPIDRLRDLIPVLMDPAEAGKIEVPIKLAERRSISEPANVTSAVVGADDAENVVHSIDGHHPADIIDAYAQLLRARPGRPIQISWSDGKTQTLVPTAAPLPDVVLQARRRLGVALQQNTPADAERFHLSREDGLFVTAVDRNSIADHAGLQAGDLLVQLGRYPIMTLDDLAHLLRYLPTTGGVRVGVVRNDQFGFGVFNFEKPSTGDAESSRS